MGWFSVYSLKLTDRLADSFDTPLLTFLHMTWYCHSSIAFQQYLQSKIRVILDNLWVAEANFISIRINQHGFQTTARNRRAWKRG